MTWNNIFYASRYAWHPAELIVEEEGTPSVKVYSSNQVKGENYDLQNHNIIIFKGVFFNFHSLFPTKYN